MNKINPSKGLTTAQISERIRQLKEERNAIHIRLSKSSISRKVEPQLHARLTVIAHDLEALSGRVGGG